jgi:hypothetical protein
MNDNHTSEIDRGIRFGMGFAIGALIIAIGAIVIQWLCAVVVLNWNNPALYLILTILGTALLINGMVRRRAVKP